MCRVDSTVCVRSMLAFAAAGCLANAPHAELDDGRAEALLREVQEQDYRAWEGPPLPEDEPRRQEAAGPHGAFVEVFLDPILAGAKDAEMTLEAWPVGSTAVADGYPDEIATEVDLVNIGQKTDDGWIWAQLDGDGNGIGYGRLEDCLACHFNGEDRIFSIELPEVEEEE
jgi:hypothetical protein